jgi:hypothetical protein
MASCHGLNSELMMLRWMMPLLVAVFTAGAAAVADEAIAKHGARRAGSQLPAGLPRAHYKYRTTVTRAAPLFYGRPIYVADGPRVLFTPWYGYLPYVRPVVGAAPLPGYYGRPFAYDYPGSYYGGPDVGYWNRLPYACGVYGYC